MSLVDAALLDQERRILQATAREVAGARVKYKRKARTIECSGGCGAERYASTMIHATWKCIPCRAR